MSKLAIKPLREEDHYNTTIKVICYDCDNDDVDISSIPVLQDVIDGVMNTLTFSRKEEVKAWELELTSCEHILCLTQDDASLMQLNKFSHCSQCSMQENLWLCLQCGNVGCGRSQFGGMGGNSHALAHASNLTHSVSVKLNSISPEGSADVFCYACNEERIDPDLALHLAHWGIMITEQKKTEKSLTEMQIEQNLKWEFTMTSSDGMDLKPIFGPGLTGLRNLGNSCYLASALQCLFSLPEFEYRYFKPQELPPVVPLPAEDLETQLRKIADGLISGRYSVPNSDTVAHTGCQDLPYQLGLAPGMLKHLIGRGHDEFSTMRQQDAFEFLLHLFKLINVNKHYDTPNPVASFRFNLEQRLQCLSCGKVRYKIDEQDNISVPVPIRRLKEDNDAESCASGETPVSSKFDRVSLRECLDIFTAEEIVELTCSGCESKKGFRKRSLFKTFPQNLIINARRFELINWVPTKLNIPVEVSDEPLDLSQYRSLGIQAGEILLEDEPSPPDIEFQPNEEAVAMLLSMGFPEIRIKKALYATGNTDTDAALNWLLSHMDDPDIDTTDISAPPGSGGNHCSNEDEAKIGQLIDMGIDRPKARKALLETDGDINRALDWVLSHPYDAEIEGYQVSSGSPAQLQGSSDIPALFQLHAIICHKGVSVHAGHYVAFVRKEVAQDEDNQWVLFNDEKVVQGGDIEEMKQFAYIYFFRKL
ncbi:ubiquitin carboxyl-terminal hydrolase 14 [Coccidioides immitis H538.4]|nr:ubiquitin carboxyl-terminal hydrolase 14 [Coccidioides immitis H538.4]